MLAVGEAHDVPEQAAMIGAKEVWIGDEVGVGAGAIETLCVVAIRG